jgi:plasmid maintenance system antidote protein VapI
MNLAPVLDAYIRKEKLSVRSVARQMGITHHNLHRILNGKNTRADNALKVITWLMSNGNDSNGKGD